MDTVGPIALKVGTRVACNFALPGSGCLLDFGEAVYNVSQGDYLSASWNVVFGVADLVTLGVAGTAKGIAQESGKQAAINVVKDSAKVSSKKIGKEAAKQIAMGGHKRLIVGAAIITAKNSNKEIGKAFSKELAKGMLGDVTEEAFKRSLLETTVQGAAMGMIGSGGKHVAAEILEGAANNFCSECVSRSSREIVKTATSTAAKKAADEVAKSFVKNTRELELVLNTGKGITKYIRL